MKIHVESPYTLIIPIKLITIASSLPEEIITEILSRLPVKSLLRFRVVCKTWKSEIQNPNFIKLHLNQTLASNSDHHLIISRKSIYITNLNLDNTQNFLSFSELHPRLQFHNGLVLGSCNGVLCVSNVYGSYVFLYNPLTNWYRDIPDNFFINTKFITGRVIYGFGYNSFTDDYKVFSFFKTYNRQNWEVVKREALVFSLNTNSWKYVRCLSQIHDFHDYRGIYLNDAIYFIVKAMEYTTKFVIKFDYRTDTMLRIECPNYDNNSVGWNLSALKGCLCMLVSAPLYVSHFWMMKDESWVKLFSICDPCDIGLKYGFSIVVFSRDEKKVLLEVHGTKYGFGWYDLENATFEIIHIDSRFFEDLSCSAFCTLGSLVSLVDDLEDASNGTMPNN